MSAGLIVRGEESLLVDTLFDMRLAHEILDEMKDAAGVGGPDFGGVNSVRRIKLSRIGWF